MPQRIVLLALALAAMLVLGCGSDDEPASTGASTSETAASDAPRFEAADVPFTFEHPSGFEQVDEPGDGKVLATVTPTPDDVNNGLKIRQTSERELPFSSYAGQLKSQFEQQLETKLKQTEVARGGTEYGLLEWSKPYEKTEAGKKETIRLHSASYFFTGGGKTWQLECLSRQEQRQEIEEACEQALETMEFPKG